MSRRLFFAEFAAADRAVVRGAEARHLAVVLRARPGEEYDLAIAGGKFRATVAKATAGAVEFENLRPVEANAARREVTLLAAIFRFERFEWMVEKATELGVAAIQPLIAARTAAPLARAAAARRERWERLALAAAQQARRVETPRVHAPVAAPAAFAGAGSGGARILLTASGAAPALSEVLAAEAGRAVALAVGPEGGWSEAEERAARDAGFAAASLGPLILRAETAAIAALALCELA